MKKRILSTFAVCLLCLICCITLASGESYGYGYMDRDGNIVIEPQFDYAYPFSCGRASVFSGTLTQYGSPSEGLYGYIDETGRMVINPVYEEASSFNDNGYAVVCKNKKYGVIDIEGKTVIDFAYDYIRYNESADTYDAFNGTLTSWGSPDTGTHNIMDINGNVLFTGSFENIYAYDGFYEVSKDGYYALLGLDGTQLTDYEFDFLTAESGDILGFRKDSKYGYMDIRGNVLIEAAYDSVGRFTDGKAIVKKDGKYSLIDTSGNVLVTYKADYVSTSVVNGRTYAFEGTLTSYGGVIRAITI